MKFSAHCLYGFVLLIAVAGCSRTGTEEPASSSSLRDESVTLPVLPASGAPSADEVLKKVSAFYASQPAFSVRVESRVRTVEAGKDVSNSMLTEIQTEKPNRLRIVSQHEGKVGTMVVSPGEKMFLFVASENVYGEMPAFADFTAFAENPLSKLLGGGPLGGTMLLALLDPDPAVRLKEGVSAMTYLGRSQVHGATADLLEFTERGLKWQVAFDVGERPLLRHVSINLTEMMREKQGSPTAAAIVSQSFSEWKFDKPAADAFVFVAPAGARESKNLLLELMAAGEKESSPLIGKAAPPVKLPQLDGGTFDLAQHKGKDIVLLDFWATWCGPCVAEMPVLAKVADEYRSRGVILRAINLQEEPAKVKQFLAEQKLDVTVVLDANGKVSAPYDPSGIPLLVVIDKQGIVRKVHRGFNPMIADILKMELDNLLGQPVQAPAAPPVAPPPALNAPAANAPVEPKANPDMLTAPEETSGPRLP